MELNQEYPQVKRQAGFSLIEILISMAILIIGLMSLLASFSMAVVSIGAGQSDLLAKQKATEALEGIYTARNTNQLGFDQIAMVSSGGIFAAGYGPLTTPGDDGLVGTADDEAAEEMVTAGRDGLLGTGDDEVQDLSKYERNIEISTINDDLRQVTVTLRYRTADGVSREYRVASYVSRFR